MAKPDWIDLNGVKTLHGVPFYSRAGDSSEEEEMQHFIQLAEVADVLDVIDGVFYDSQNCLCIIESPQALHEDSEEAAKVLDIGARSLDQFVWLGVVHHKQ